MYWLLPISYNDRTCNDNETLTHLVHEPEKREQRDDERRVNPDLHQRYLRLRPPECDFGRFVDDRPRVDLFALHERGEGEHAQDVPALLVDFLVNDRDRDFMVLAPREFSVAIGQVVSALLRVARAISNQVVCLIGHCFVLARISTDIWFETRMILTAAVGATPSETLLKLYTKKWSVTQIFNTSNKMFYKSILLK